MKNRSIKSLWMVLALALVTAFAALPSSPGTRVALADGGGERGHTFDITFTKWVTSFPTMAGVVGGDVGTGTFAGEILNYIPGTDITKIEALYHINGRIHSLTAHVFVTQNNVTGRAAIEGVVTDGWLKGRQARGGYNVISGCPGNPGGPCFQGTLHIHVGSEH